MMKAFIAILQDINERSFFKFMQFILSFFVSSLPHQITYQRTRHIAFVIISSDLSFVHLLYINVRPLSFYTFLDSTFLCNERTNYLSKDKYSKKIGIQYAILWHNIFRHSKFKQI